MNAASYGSKKFISVEYTKYCTIKIAIGLQDAPIAEYRISCHMVYVATEYNSCNENQQYHRENNVILSYTLNAIGYPKVCLYYLRPVSCSTEHGK